MEDNQRSRGRRRRVLRPKAVRGTTTWSCPRCTFEESVLRPGCSICGEERPDEADPECPIVFLKEKFECPICCDDEEVGLHFNTCKVNCRMCKNCARYAIMDARDGLPKCSLCRQPIAEMAMRKLLTPEEWSKRLDRVFSKGVASITTAFHCVTPDCHGWVDVDADKQSPFFMCQVCHRVNCVACRAVHDGVTCQHHFENVRKSKSVEMSEDYLENLLKEGKAMRCPGCQMTVQKIDGCSFLMCGNPACKMQLCWLTKGPRWGPGGRGDTSGGCRCGVNGKKCHPECWWCHS